MTDLERDLDAVILYYQHCRKQIRQAAMDSWSQDGILDDGVRTA